MPDNYYNYTVQNSQVSSQEACQAQSLSFADLLNSWLLGLDNKCNNSDKVSNSNKDKNPDKNSDSDEEGLEICLGDRVQRRLSYMKRKFKEIKRAYQGVLRYWESKKQAVKAFFITLTYRPGVIPEEKHISRFVDAVNKFLKRKYKLKTEEIFQVWVREEQKRGVVHYHLLYVLPSYVFLDYPDQRWWRWGHSNLQIVRRNMSAVLGYLMKYMSKVTEFYEDTMYSLEAAYEEKAVSRSLLKKWYRKRLFGVGYKGLAFFYSLIQTLENWYDYRFVKKKINKELKRDFCLWIDHWTDEEDNFWIRIKGYRLDGVNIRRKFEKWRDVISFVNELYRSLREEYVFV